MLKDYNVTIMGDSIAKGLYLENDKIKRIKNSAVKLTEQYFSIKTNNISSFGQSLKKFTQKGFIDTYIENSATQNNRIAIISLGGNDCAYDWEKVGENPYVLNQPITTPYEYGVLLNSVVKKLKNKGVLVCLTSLPPIISEKYFNEIIAKQADTKGVLKFFTGDITNISRHHECYNNIILRTALSNNCPFIDFRSDFLLKTDMPSYICSDGIHPNEKGHFLMFERIKERIENSVFLKQNEPLRIAQGS